MYATEKALLAATNVTGFDALAQRALRLRQELKRLVDFAIGNNAAVLTCLNIACTLGTVLNAAHIAQGYGFLRGVKVVSADDEDPSLAFAELREVVGTITEVDAEAMLTACREVIDTVRKHVPSVAIQKNGRPCFYILHGDLFHRALQHAPPAANAA